MKNSLLTALGLALLRIVASVLIMTHGFSKFQQLISGNFQFADPLGIGEAPTLFLAVIGEFIAPIFVIFGYKTRLATLPTLITMLVAAFVVHGPDPFVKKELALVYALIFSVVLLLGPGKYSVDKR